MLLLSVVMALAVTSYASGTWVCGQCENETIGGAGCEDNRGHYMWVLIPYDGWDNVHGETLCGHCNGAYFLSYHDSLSGDDCDEVNLTSIGNELKRVRLTPTRAQVLAAVYHEKVKFSVDKTHLEVVGCNGETRFKQPIEMLNSGSSPAAD